MSRKAGRRGGRGPGHGGRAGFAVACLVYALAAAPLEPPDGTCERPGEIGARGGHTVRVRCDAGAGVEPVRGPARRLFGLAYSVNGADAGTLEALPGIGPARAAAILRARDERPFASVGELLRVPGIGPVTLARVAPLLTVDGAGREALQPERAPAESGRGERGDRP